MLLVGAARDVDRGEELAEGSEVLALTAVHAVGYLVVSGVVAAVVYEKVGLRCLRSGWINLDLVWALALVATGAGTLLV